MRLVALVVVALAPVGCGVTIHLPPPRLICADGIPARLFIDPRCPSGVCGYTCAPDRWADVHP